MQCPHRSELSGLIGAVQHINLICQQHNIQQGYIELGCDGLEAYKVATRHHFRPSCNIGHFDLASTLHRLIQNSQMTWTFRHVKGHQDDTVDIQSIDIWGRLNMVADAKAKVALWEHITEGNQPTQYTSISNALPALYTKFGQDNTMIVSNLKKRLRHHISTHTILQYWEENNKQVYHENSDMAAFHHAAKNIPLHLQRWITKWSCGICGVGKWLERWKEQPHSKCPRCLTNNETVDHVIHCQHQEATLCWNTGIEGIRTWMSLNNSIPGLAEAVGLRLSQWRNNQPLTDIPHMDGTVMELIHAQDSLGWDAFCFGTVHNLWSREQGMYLLALGKRTTGTTWISRLIRKVWELQHSMWIHRNSYVHKDNKSIHQHEEEALNRVIREEFVRGRDGLSPEYVGLFRGTADAMIGKDSATRMRWLSHVWAGRDRLRNEEGLDPLIRDPLASSFIRRNIIRRKRRRGIG